MIGNDEKYLLERLISDITSAVEEVKRAIDKVEDLVDETKSLVSSMDEWEDIL